MNGSRRLQWGSPEEPPPKHPYRDTLLVYGAFAVVLVLIAWATGGEVVNAIVVAAFFFIAATLWSITRWRTRLRREAAASERERIL